MTMVKRVLSVFALATVLAASLFFGSSGKAEARSWDYSCQNAWASFNYAVDPQATNTYWSFTVNMTVTGCWNSSRAWTTYRYVTTSGWKWYNQKYQSTASATLKARSQGSLNIGTSANWYSYYYVTSSYAICGFTGCAGVGPGTWATYADMWLRPSTSATAGQWSAVSSVGFVSGQDASGTPSHPTPAIGKSTATIYYTSY